MNKETSQIQEKEKVKVLKNTFEPFISMKSILLSGQKFLINNIFHSCKPWISLHKASASTYDSALGLIVSTHLKCLPTALAVLPYIRESIGNMKLTDLQTF